MKIVITAEDVNDWVYKGEGAANLILSYQGSLPLLLGKVLRVQKVSKDETIPPMACAELSTHEQLIWANVDGLVESKSKDSLAQIYVTSIMGPLLGTNHIDAGVRVSVSREFLEKVEVSTLNFRPAWRIKASKIDTLTHSALLISDHSVFPSNSTFSIAVEIKPKCGFLPSSEYISDENSVKKHVTRYKMHQALKRHKKQILEESAYDPLDLFSHSNERIHKALNALYLNPQNNFRVFLNGSLVYGGMDTDTNTHDTNNSFEELIGTSSGLNLDLPKFFELLTEMISKSDVLNQLLKTQKLDLYDIEGAIHSYYDVISKPCPLCKSISDNGLLKKYEKLHSLPIQKSIEIVRDYLVSATTKDCSLMLSFRPREGESPSLEKYGSVGIESVDQVYDYKVFSIDLDMKPLEKMVHYYNLDQKITNFYKQKYHELLL
ncbi:Inositol-pentakisphosphate 2-kinase [Rhynchospora pubera]|uniref:Inositol-pentakisphosphate 2-kinase n=1 Tax=Rhynchospora pubera TaxID=906938 RepID=A0AAV8CEJ8_9POAL|nr:Inositol-pentakisphosphate 2-kinase [Rhynchospora pubera]KAJ4792745.1 Inositol-pentakisphosphate 2-kinase [Rhynchospora pubera]